MKVLRTINLTFWIGALLFGGVISLLHVRLNQLTSVRESFAMLGFCMLLYGASSAAAGLIGVLLTKLFSRTRRRRRTAAPEPGSGEPETGVNPFAALLPALLSFQAPFWIIAWAYGRTYDQTPPFAIETPIAMLLYLVAGSGIVTLGVLALCLATARGFARWPKGATRILFFAGGLLLGPHLILPTGYDKNQRNRSASAVAEGEITVTPASEGPASTSSVVVIGLDGADPWLIERLIEAGELPNFARLKREGTWSQLETLPDANSAVIWATIYSGAQRDEHGILDFYRISLPGIARGVFPVHRTFFKEACDLLAPTPWVSQTLVSAADMDRPALWQVIDHAGLGLGVVDGYFYSFPALTPKAEHSWFVSYGADGFERQLRAGRMSLEELGLFIQPRKIYPAIKDVLPQDDFRWQSETLLALLDAEQQPRFVNLYTHEPDSVQHRSWRQIEPEKYLFPGAASALSEAEITRVHRSFDSFLGELLERIAPETQILIVSDHGHVPTLVHALDTQHRHGPAGLLLAWGPAFKAGYTLPDSHVLDIFPTVLHLLGLPVPEDGRGRVLEDALEPPFSGGARKIASYRFLTSAEAGGARRNEILNQQEIDKLKELGYL